MWNTSLSDGYGMSGYGGGYGGWGGGGFGGATGGAFVGGLAGGLIGDVLFDRDGRRGHGGCEGGEKVVQINENGKGRGDCCWTDVEILEKLGNIQYEIPTQTVALQKGICDNQFAIMESGMQQIINSNNQFNSLSKEICAGDFALQKDILCGNHQTALQLCHNEEEMQECCCKIETDILKMGFETQLREQAQFGAIMKEMAEVKCLIKDTEKDEIIRNQAGQINQMSQAFQTRSIQDCIKDAFCKESSALNQIGVNQKLTAPDTTFWPPFVPNLGCC